MGALPLLEANNHLRGKGRRVEGVMIRELRKGGRRNKEVGGVGLTVAMR